MPKQKETCDEQFARKALDGMDDSAQTLLDISMDAVLVCGWTVSSASLKLFQSAASHSEPALEMRQ
jgi:hypothetical protein